MLHCLCNSLLHKQCWEVVTTENWNFHGHIALPLEEYGRIFVGNSFRTADEIERGEFVGTMLAILLNKFGTLDGLQDFLGLCSDYMDLPATEIPEGNAKEIFNEFKRLVNLK